MEKGDGLPRGTSADMERVTCVERGDSLPRGTSADMERVTCVERGEAFVKKLR